MTQPGRVHRKFAPEKLQNFALFTFFAFFPIRLPSQAQQPITTKPFTIIERKWAPQEILTRYTKAGAPVWAEGEVLTFFHRGEAQVVHVKGSFEVPMRRIEDTDIWTVAVEIPKLSRAVISYRFTTDNPAALLQEQPGKATFQYWRGPYAPEPPKHVTTISGQIREHTIESDRLKESRQITVYLPPQYDKDHRYPVIYMADGQDVPDYAIILEALILERKTPETVLIGIHSGSYQGDREKAFDPTKDLRGIEYLVGIDQFLPGVGPYRFSSHEHFFLHEVAHWAEEHLGVSADRKQRILFGVSNGASFAVSMGIRNPKHFGKILAFSVGWEKAVTVPEWDSKAYPHFYLAVGTLDDGFFETTLRWAEILKRQGFEYIFLERVSGHDALMWREEFARAVVWALTRSRPGSR